MLLDHIVDGEIILGIGPGGVRAVQVRQKIMGLRLFDGLGFLYNAVFAFLRNVLGQSLLHPMRDFDGGLTAHGIV